MSIDMLMFCIESAIQDEHLAEDDKKEEILAYVKNITKFINQYKIKLNG